jgi:SAM-dependent MidA family methyltransferase
MTPAGALLRQIIAREGPISFARFMEVALYHPEHGYYRRDADPFGKRGDFYTAEQIQPVFGILIAAAVRSLCQRDDAPPGFTVVELGAGRAEMVEAFAEWRYVPVEWNREPMPERFRGVVFANEFFDALPVRVVRRAGGQIVERCVGAHDSGFFWTEQDAVVDVRDWLERHEPGAEGVVEVCLEARRWLEGIGARLQRGWLVVIDYGYTRQEAARFPDGTLMSYRRHQASGDVLAEPGLRDITAHVNFTALEEHGRAVGFERESFESLAQFLLKIGDADQFAAALAGTTEAERLRRRLQLKTLLFGMGETFRVLVMRKRG